jgi:hypothetical protein
MHIIVHGEASTPPVPYLVPRSDRSDPRCKEYVKQIKALILISFCVTPYIPINIISFFLVSLVKVRLSSLGNWPIVPARMMMKVEQSME